MTRTHRDRTAPRLVGALAAGLLAGGCHTPRSPAAATTPTADGAGEVLCGIDVLVRARFAPLRGSRVGLITNQTGHDRRGVSTVDHFLRAPGLQLVALFSPEHGFAGVLEGKVTDSVHEASGIPIHSLYGATRAPTAAMLEGLDVLVFDIQDIGCRFYTYVSTMGLAMEAAAAAGIRFVVLDRPNPLGGLVVAGPVLDPGMETFVGWHTVALRHGMTAGELAAMFNTERRIGVDLTVVRCAGWRRGDLFDATGLLWTNPSPNMRSLTQALLYPGVGLLETTNLSVGRGTDTPFEIIGAPWLDGIRLARRLNAAGIAGARFIPVRFTPDASKFAGVACGGVRFVITHRAVFDPLLLGMELACALRDQHPEWETARYNRLLRDQALYGALLAGRNATELVESWRRELEAFRLRRARYLTY